MTTIKKTELNSNSSLLANPRITLQVEPDRWGFLYDPDRDLSLGINPESVFLWKQLGNKTTIKKISAKIKKHFNNVPGEIEKDVMQLIKRLLGIGFVTVTPEGTSN